MKPGDIIFFSAETPAQLLNAWLQRIGRSRHGEPNGRWCHAAICVYGPLVLHAMPRKGVHLEILEAPPTTQFTIFRSLEAINEASFREACIFWLGESYTLKTFVMQGIWHYPTKGYSFCSSLVQKVFQRLNKIPFVDSSRPLLPIELFDVLKNSGAWKEETSPLTSHENFAQLGPEFAITLLEEERTLLCPVLQRAMEQEVFAAHLAKDSTAAVNALLTAVDRMLESDVAPTELKAKLVESLRKGSLGDRPEEPLILAYRALLAPGVQAADLNALQKVTSVNWRTADYDARMLAAFSPIERGRRETQFIDGEVALDLRLISTVTRFFEVFRRSGLADGEAAALLTQIVGHLEHRGVTSIGGLEQTVQEIQKDIEGLASGPPPNLTPLPSLLRARLAVLEAIREIFARLNIEFDGGSLKSGEPKK